jgi:tetratricopeptide (TPR) repeat protein
MLSRLTLALILSSIFLGPQAMAAKGHPTPKEQSREREAKKACLSEGYVKGIAILAELYVETGEAAYLFNQGRCYEQNVRYQEAAERFREYLNKAKLISRAERAEAEKRMADCEAAAKAQLQARPTAEPIAPPAPVAAVAAAPVPIAPAPQPPLPSATVKPRSSQPATVEHSWLHTAKWIASGAAVAFLGLGGVEYYRYYSKNRDYNNDPRCYSLGLCQSLADQADTAQTVAIVGFAAAAVSAGLAVTFWLTDPPSGPEKHAGLSVICAPSLAGAACSGRF